MLRQLMRAKIHRARVTQADLHYEGSIGIDPVLLEASAIVPHEHVHVWNVTRGTRFETYAIEGHRNSGDIQINGAAAHLADPGDIVIITSFALLQESEIAQFHPKVVLVDPDTNKIKSITDHSGHTEDEC